MPWIIEKIEHPAWAAKYGHDLHDTARYDPYELACIIEDSGEGIAYLSNATGIGKLPDHHELFKKLADLGFKKIRWVRVVDANLPNGKNIKKGASDKEGTK